MPKPPRTEWYVDDVMAASRLDGEFYVATIRTPTDESVAEAIAATSRGAIRRAHIILKAMRAAEESRGIRRGDRRR